MSFGGNAYSYSHLSTPPNRFGMASPLRNLWATNISILASKFDYTRIRGHEYATVPGKEYINNYDEDDREWNTLLTDDHITCSALELVNCLNFSRKKTVPLTSLPSTSVSTSIPKSDSGKSATIS